MYTDPRQYDVAVGATAFEIGSVDGHPVYDGGHSIPHRKLQDESVLFRHKGHTDMSLLLSTGFGQLLLWIRET